jgi:hypothetical protein
MFPSNLSLDYDNKRLTRPQARQPRSTRLCIEERLGERIRHEQRGRSRQEDPRSRHYQRITGKPERGMLLQLPCKTIRTVADTPFLERRT